MTSTAKKPAGQMQRRAHVGAGAIVESRTRDRGLLNVIARDIRIDRSFTGDTAEMIKMMRTGTPATVIPDLAVRFGISQDALFEVLRLPRSTMKSRINKKEVLSASEQDRMYRADRVWTRAVEVLEDEEAARKWISQKNRSLGGEAPLSLLDTEVGYELVVDTLGRIEHGVVS